MILYKIIFSAFSLTKPSKEYETVEDGTVGKKNIPNGGLIGCGYPIGASGVKNAMMLNIGGSATTNYVFVVGRE